MKIATIREGWSQFREDEAGKKEKNLGSSSATRGASFASDRHNGELSQIYPKSYQKSRSFEGSWGKAIDLSDHYLQRAKDGAKDKKLSFAYPSRPNLG